MRFQATGYRSGMAWSLERLAIDEAIHGAAERAARLLGVAAVVRALAGEPADDVDRRELGDATDRVTLSLGEAGFATRYAAGAALGLSEAVAEGLGVAPDPPTEGQVHPSPGLIIRPAW